jgi:rhamnose utilization protein RhaD (predicted bifunctional aldolase and dehydrogenase)
MPRLLQTELKQGTTRFCGTARVLFSSCNQVEDKSQITRKHMSASTIGYYIVMPSAVKSHMHENSFQKQRSALLRLSQELGSGEYSLAILGEGNVSARRNEDSLIVKASGTSLATLQEQDLVHCDMNVLLPLLDKIDLTDAEMETKLLACRMDSKSKKPSVETFFHAYLLTLPKIEFVAHTHPLAVSQILCSPMARAFAEKRLFPDQIVYCGLASVFVPYTDPGLPLAQAIRSETGSFIKKYGDVPQTILLENHGLIALGTTAQAVLAATLMMEKSAKVLVGATGLAGPKFLTGESARRIARRPDEEYRRHLGGS